MIYRRLPFSTWGLGNAFRDLDRMRREMASLFGGLDNIIPRVSAGVFPAIKLSETGGNYLIRAELPGVKAEDLEIQATANNLSLSGERKIDAAGDEVRYHRRERDAGKFSRVIGLPGEIDADNIDAHLENGLLTITVPKAAAAKPRQITVN
jgi:HSP20 family protein